MALSSDVKLLIISTELSYVAMHVLYFRLKSLKFDGLYFQLKSITEIYLCNHINPGTMENQECQRNETIVCMKKEEMGSTIKKKIN